MWHRLFYGLGMATRLVADASKAALSKARDEPATPMDRGWLPPDAVRLFRDPPDLTDRHRLAAAAMALVAETGWLMVSRPSVQAYLEGILLNLIGGMGTTLQPPDTVRQSTDDIAQILEERNIAPNRLGIDGLPGSGKSTLARSLATKLDMQWKSFDYENVNVPREFSLERAIYEHHRLFRTQDVDVFDAIIYIDEPVDVSKAKVLRRARTQARPSLTIDVLDYPKLKTIGRAAFDVCEGQPISIPGTPLLMKVRPPGGYRAVETLASRLHEAGHEPTGLGKEEMLFLLIYGKPQSGLTAYLQPGAFNEEIISGLAAGIRTLLAQ